MGFGAGLCVILAVFLPMVQHSVQQKLCYNTMEIVVVVDGSYSIPEDTFHGPVKNVLRSFSSNVYDLGASNRMGLVLFSQQIDYTINLTYDMTSYQSQVSNLNHPMGGTGTFLAIKRAAVILHDQARAQVPKIMLVITDGESSDIQRTIAEANAAKQDNIQIYAVWVGSDITDEIKQMASSSEHIVSAADYTQLALKLADLVKCSVDGGWTNWNLVSYGDCSVTCGEGSRSRNEIRSCTNPTPKNEGKPCTGSTTRTVSETCNTNIPCQSAVDGGWTDWQLLNYGPCSVTCGVGTRTRNDVRYCSNPSPQNGGRFCPNNNKQSYTVQCDTKVPCQITGLCKTAKLINGVGYRNHPTDCDKFVQCYYRSTGYTLAVVRMCSYGQYWDQSRTTCRPSCYVDCPLERCKDDCVSTYKMDGSCRGYWSCNNGKSEPMCCPMGFSYFNKRGCLLDFSCRDQCPVICKTPEVCELRPVWTNTHNFEKYPESKTSWVEASCLKTSLYFDIIGCQCSAAATTSCSATMTMNFDNPNRLTSDPGVQASSTNLQVGGGVALFNGNSKITTDLKVPQPGYPISVRFHYHETSPVTSRQVLVSAPWCRKAETVSMVIFLDVGVIGIEVKNWYGTQMRMTIPTQGFTDQQWKNAMFSYDGSFITGSVEADSIKHTNRAYAPRQVMVECGMVFGTDDSASSFKGQMDMIQVFLCDPTVPNYN